LIGRQVIGAGILEGTGMIMARRIRTGVMILAWWLAIALIAVATQPTNDSWSMLRTSHLTIALHAFAALLALWVAFGRSSRQRRAFGLFAGTMIVVMGFSLFGEWPDYWYLLIAAAVQVSAILGCGLLLRGIWAGVMTLVPAGSSIQPAPSPMPFRWSIKDMTLAIAAIAALLTPLTSMRPIGRDFGQLPIEVVCGLTLAAVSLATAWAVCRRLNSATGSLTLLLSITLAISLQLISYKLVFLGIARINFNYHIQRVGYSVLLHALLLYGPLKLTALHRTFLGRIEAGSST